MGMTPLVIIKLTVGSFLGLVGLCGMAASFSPWNSAVQPAICEPVPLHFLHHQPLPCVIPSLSFMRRIFSGLGILQEILPASLEAAVNPSLPFLTGYRGRGILYIM